MAGYAKRLIQYLRIGLETSSNFPYDKGDKYWRNPKKPHMLNIGLKENQTTQLNENSFYFDIGNEAAEAKAPQYHILEDAKIIRRPNKGTKKSLGTQATIREKEKRDYGVVVARNTTQTKSSSFGKVEYIQEYRQNLGRNFWGQAEKSREQIERMKYHYTYNRNWRPNAHWQYIERILTQIAPQMANDINAKLVVSESLLSSFGENQPKYFTFQNDKKEWDFAILSNKDEKK